MSAAKNLSTNNGLFGHVDGCDPHRVHYLVVVLQQDPDHTLHALHLHGLACKVQQVLQGISGVGGLAEVDV